MVIHDPQTRLTFLYHHRTQRKGVEGVHVENVIESLRKLGHNVTEIALVSGDQATESSHTKRNSNALIKLFRWFASHSPNIVFRLSEILYNLFAFLKLVHAIREKKHDIIYERYAYFNFAGILVGKLYRVPVILEVNIVSTMNDVRNLKLAWLTRRIEHKILRTADAIFVVSDYLKGHLVSSGIDHEKIYVQPNAFTVEESSIIEKHTIPLWLAPRIRRQIVIGFMGRLLPWYRLDALLQSFNNLSKKWADIHLLFIGDGSERKALEERVEMYVLSDKVSFCGEVSHLEALTLLNACDVCVIPSTNLWGSPMKLFEYMGMGKPVVAPEINVITSVLLDSVHGRTFPYDNFALFEKRLDELIASPGLRESMGKSAREHIIANHTWGKVAEHIVGVARGILSSPR